MCCGKVLNEVGTLMHTQQSELILVFYLNSIKKKAVRFFHGLSWGWIVQDFFVKLIVILPSPSSVTFSDLYTDNYLMYYILLVVLIMHHE